MIPTFAHEDFSDFPTSLSSANSEVDTDEFEWISNGRDSDDDSVHSHGSDHEDLNSPFLSRRSSISVSSREGEVQVWEGIRESEESADETPQAIHPETLVALPVETTSDVDSPSPDSLEDHLFKDALDQSMMGTLSASRTKSLGGGTTHSSLRDLKLAFPDPISSSLSELNRSYEEVAIVPPTVSTPESIDQSVHLTTSDASAAEPALTTELPVLPQHQVGSLLDSKAVELDIVLYGANTSVKWSFVQDLVRKAALGSGRTLAYSCQTIPDTVRHLHLEKHISSYESLVDTIAIHDQTTQESPSQTVPGDLYLLPTFNRPSLAIVYLPSMAVDLPEHSSYLPVILPPSVLSGAKEPSHIVHAAAEETWKTMSVPAYKTLDLTDDKGVLINAADISQVSPTRVNRAFRSLVPAPRKRGPKTLTEHLNSVHAVTVVALVSLVASFVFNIGVQGPTPTATHRSTAVSAYMSTAQQTWVVSKPLVDRNESVVTPPLTPAMTSAVISSPHKEVSVSVFVPPPASPIASPAVAAAGSSLGTSLSPSSPKTAECIQCSTDLTAVKLSSRDVSLPAAAAPTKELNNALYKPTSPVIATASGSNTAVVEASTSYKHPLSEAMSMVDAGVKAFAESVQQDTKELIETISEQSKAVMEQSVGMAQAVAETLQYRHGRAKGKAKEILDSGEQFLAYASEQFNNIGARTVMAQKKAKELKDSYSRAQSSWATRFEQKGRDKLARRHDRVLRRADRRAHRRAKTCPYA